MTNLHHIELVFDRSSSITKFRGASLDGLRLMIPRDATVNIGVSDGGIPTVTFTVLAADVAVVDASNAAADPRQDDAT